MSVIRVGSTGKYADGWDLVFGKSGGRTAAAGKAKAGKRRKPATPAKKAAAVAKKTARAAKVKVATKRRTARRTRRG